MAALRAAQYILDGRPVAIPFVEEGRRLRWTGRSIRLPALSGVTLVCGNALAPPLQAEQADIVTAVNLVDNVSEPVNLLGQLLKTMAENEASKLPEVEEKQVPTVA